MTALEISEYIIQKYPENATNLRINKLLYFIQGIHFQFYREALFADDFEAWTKGPVIPKVYHAYKIFGAYPIKTNCNTIDLGDKQAFIDKVLQHYSTKSTEELVNLSYQTKPWKDNYAMSINLISKFEIAKYFMDLF